MASALVLPYQQPTTVPMYAQPYATNFPTLDTSDHYPSQGSPLSFRFPRYNTSKSTLTPDPYEDVASAGAIAAAKAAGDTSGPTPRSMKLGNKRRSLGSANPITGPASEKSARSDLPRATAAKDKIKSNLKKVAPQKPDPATTLDLSLTAEENERRTGIPIYSRDSGARSLTDVHFVPMGRRRNNTYGASTEYSSFKPSAPFTNSIRPTSRPHSPYVTLPTTYTNSSLNDDLESSGHLSAVSSQRPSLRIKTSTDIGSLASMNRPRRGTNQSSASVMTSTSKPRKSMEKAFSIVTRRGSSATVEAMDPATRVASIQAARQAFAERQEAKDAKYEKRAAKDREKQEKREMRKSESRNRSNSNAVKKSDTVPLSEKPQGAVETMAYNDLPIPPPSSRPTMGTRMMSEKQKFSRKRKVKNRYARFLSWLKTRLLNLGRGSRL